MTYDYDVCFSFAGEQRAYVERAADLLRNAGVTVFYDRYEQAALWGKDLYEHLTSIYRDRARFCVIFVSADYAAKHWTTLERKSAQARAVRENSEYILPARFDDTELPGLNPTVGYIDLRNVSPDALAQLVIQKVRAASRRPQTLPRTLGLNKNDSRIVDPRVESREPEYAVAQRKLTKAANAVGCLKALYYGLTVVSGHVVFIAALMTFTPPGMWRRQTEYNWDHMSEQWGPSCGGLLVYLLFMAIIIGLLNKFVHPRAAVFAYMGTFIGVAFALAAWSLTFYWYFPNSPLGPTIGVVVSKSLGATITIAAIVFGYAVFVSRGSADQGSAG